MEKQRFETPVFLTMKVYLVRAVPKKGTKCTWEWFVDHEKWFFRQSSRSLDRVQRKNLLVQPIQLPKSNSI